MSETDMGIGCATRPDKPWLNLHELALGEFLQHSPTSGRSVQTTTHLHFAQMVASASV